MHKTGHKKCMKYCMKQNTYKKLNDSRGQTALIVAVLFTFASLLVIGGVTGAVLTQAREITNIRISNESYYLAEGAMEDVLYRIISGKQTSASETLTLNGEVATVSIIETTGGNKEITVDGNVLSRLRRVKSELSTTATGVAFFFGAQTGEGGLEMNQNSRIEGIGGSVGSIYSNGPIVGSTGATVTGDAIVATAITEDFLAESTVCTQDEIVGQAKPKIDYAQSFTPAISGPLAKVSIYIKKVGDPSSRKVKIVADNGGSPNGSTIEEGTLNKNLIGSTYGWIDVTFNTPPVLTSVVTYWIVLDAKENSNKYFLWCSDSGSGYTDGVAKYTNNWSSVAWTQITGDLAFKTFSGVGSNGITNITVGGKAQANTIVDSTIGGDAYYQSISGSTVGGTEFPGSNDPPVLNMPLSDANLTQWKADALVGGVIIGDCGDSGNPACVIGNGDTLWIGPKKIDGNLSLSSQQSLVVTGTLHVTGNIDFDGNGAAVSCDTSYNNESCIIIADGWVHVKNNITFSGSGSANSFLTMISTLDGCIGVSGVSCTHHYGAIDIHNNSGGALFYAMKGMMNLHNNVEITAAVAYKLRLDNSSTIIYETGIANTYFSSGPSGGWSISAWDETQ